MTFVTTHFKKSTTETMCLLSQLLSKKSHFTVFTSNVQFVCLAAGWCIQVGDATNQWQDQPNAAALPHSVTVAFFSWFTVVNYQHW